MIVKRQGLSRRRFLQVVAGTGGALVLGVHLPRPAHAESERPDANRPNTDPNVFITLTPDNRVEVMIKHLEMGQGAFTGLAMLVGEELDAAWDQLVAKPAPGDPTKFNHTQWGPMQGTGGSTGLSSSYLQMRQVGAAMRQMLLAAAAKRWGVKADTLRTEQGQVINGNERLSYGELAEAARAEPVPNPDGLTLKNPDQFIYIGKPMPRLDKGKTDGSAIYTQDINLPGMLTAVVIHPPRFGAKVTGFNANGADKADGVEGIVTFSNGVAVVAKDFWTAQSAAKQVKVSWDESNAERLSTSAMWETLKGLTNQPGLIAEQKGDASTAFIEAAHTVEMDFATPFLPHATMEPMNCVARVDKDGCELWSGFQMPTGDQMGAARILGIKPEQVKANVLIAGSSFGRRANPAWDYGLECVDIARQFPGKPVKVVWTREVDTRAGWYRPAYYQRVKAAVDGEGKLLAWQQHIAGKSVVSGTPFESALVHNGIDHTSIEGATDLPYAFPNTDFRVHNHNHGVPVQWWRAVGHNHTALAKEVTMDALARKAGQDPVQFRLQQGTNPRYNAVLKTAAEKAGWGKEMGANRGMGVAVQFLFESYVALVAEVTMEGDEVKVDKITCVVDCGLAVDPDIVAAQMEGGIGFGLGQVLFSTLSIEDGKVKQSNFQNHKVARMRDMPEVEVHIMPSAEPPTGVGEPATAVVAPAVVNAVAAATGKYRTHLPLMG
ncbi:xanthine dehydrogenase family protein molybdopterin-binding subunit [Ferrimonas balearica]|uniref:xanthine dehydrogenase family protein molybdopterin-binding subunit n=1 Tax=Ferrimonas balearica TaxID=44012 RepID=UPI001C55B501|nr:molybdopterin cofactor-binding domain-containing protein [Ferrimonas balearica]MBW3165895.1 molybdopterin-dependent oxidoreductase [Ferrimonas balearica]